MKKIWDKELCSCGAFMYQTCICSPSTFEAKPITFESLALQYKEFCEYRKSLTRINLAPRRIDLYSYRVFDGKFFNKHNRA